MPNQGPASGNGELILTSPGALVGVSLEVQTGITNNSAVNGYGSLGPNLQGGICGNGVRGIQTSNTGLPAPAAPVNITNNFFNILNPA